MWRICRCLLLLSACAVSLQAQTGRPSAGERVRVRIGEAGAQIFIFENVVGDTVVLQRGGALTPLRVPLTAIDRFQVSRGHRSAGSRALRGAGWGLLTGAATGATLGFASGDDHDGFLDFTAGEKASIAALFFGSAGMVVGTVVGVVHNPEQWRTVRLDQIALGAAGGRIELAFRYRL